MSKILILSNTYYQLIFAIQMKLTVLKDDEVDILISDQSKDSLKVVKRLESEDIFGKCYYIQTKKITQRKKTAFSIVSEIYDGVFGSNKFADLGYYNKLIVHNFDIISYSLFAYLSRYNVNLYCDRFEEGIISYRNIEQYSKKKAVINKIRHLLHKNTLEEACSFFYCFYPEFYNGKYCTSLVPAIKCDEIDSILTRIFEVKLKPDDYKQKYIYFTSVYDFEGGESIHEFELVNSLADLLGKDNILIKIHPRDSRGVYEEKGFQIDRNSTIPWEVIQLCRDFSDKKLLSTNSTSILSANLMTEKGAKAYYTYKLCNINDNPAAIKTTSIIEELLIDEKMRVNLSKVKSIDSLMEILEDNE